jgi:hypothetical protein
MPFEACCPGASYPGDDCPPGICYALNIFVSRQCICVACSVGGVRARVPHAMHYEVAGIATKRETGLPHVSSSMEVPRRVSSSVSLLYFHALDENSCSG